MYPQLSLNKSFPILFDYKLSGLKIRDWYVIYEGYPTFNIHSYFFNGIIAYLRAFIPHSCGTLDINILDYKAQQPACLNKGRGINFDCFALSFISHIYILNKCPKYNGFSHCKYVFQTRLKRDKAWETAI